MTGFLLAGIGEMDASLIGSTGSAEKNYFVVQSGLEPVRSRHSVRAHPSSHQPGDGEFGTGTEQEKIADAFKRFTTDDDISVILISQEVHTVPCIDGNLCVSSADCCSFLITEVLRAEHFFVPGR